jgi:hypothetical protein
MFPPNNHSDTPMSAISRNSPLRQFLTILSVILVIGSHQCLEAQTASEFAITKIEPQIVTRPALSYSGATQKTAQPKSWLEIEVTFASQSANPVEKYTDDLVINYYVLLSNKTVLFPQGALLTGQTALTSVPAKQNDLKSVIYLSPRSMERLFDGKAPTSTSSAIVDIGVTLTKQGQIVAQKSLKGSGVWWPQFQQTPGYLLNKSETPFASLNWEYYEQVKKQ